MSRPTSDREVPISGSRLTPRLRRSAFLRGVARLAEFGGIFERPSPEPPSATGVTAADWRAIGSDWEAIGGDIRRAMARAASETGVSPTDALVLAAGTVERAPR